MVGVEFPKINGKVSTLQFSKQVWASSIAAINPNAAIEIIEQKNWRNSYSKYVEQHVSLCLTSPSNAITIAKAGLEYCSKNFLYEFEDKTTLPLADIFSRPPSFQFETGIIKGEKINTEKKIKIPYNNNLLSGEKLLNQLKEWEKYGTIEPSVTEAIKYLLDNPNVTDLSDKYFVLLGAASAMGPFELLISLGANIIAVDINRPAIWKRLISRTRRSSGTLYFPIKKPTNSPTGKAKISQFAGCNLFNEVVEITHWLDGLFPGKELMIGSYVYLDGEKHVRLIMSCDMILQYLSKRRKISIANLCTPTDCHPIPADAKAASLERYNSFSLTNIALSPFRVVTAGRWLKKNMHCEPIHAEDGNEYQIVNAIVLRQGPNYILAKRIQHWRSIVARSEGIPVSTNVAPSTSTASVVHQRSFAWAYDGMPFFPPMEIFEEKTSSALMAALLIHDITNQNAVANPAVKLDNQMEIFMNQSVHGGIWRMAYSMDSITEPSAAVHFVKIFVKSKITHAVTAICVLVPVGYKLYSRM